MIVYKYTNKINGKVYIGITTRTLQQRHMEHIREIGNGTYFHNALAKYGVENFELEQIDQAKTKEELADKEREYINKYNSFAPRPKSNGYNLTTGGDGLAGRSGKLNAQYGVSVKERMGDRYQEYLQIVKDTRVKGKDHHCYGKHPVEIFGKTAWARNIELSRKRWTGADNPQKQSPRKGKDNPFYGKHFSDEAKDKQRATREANGTSVLSMDIAKEIRVEYASGRCSQRELANKYKVSRGTIYDIVTNRIYKVESLGYNPTELENIREEERVKKISKPIAMTDGTGNILKAYPSIKQASVEEGLSISGIAKHLKKKVKTPRFIYI